SLRFMDAYQKDINGKQAAWPSKKYCGHRVLPERIFEELAKTKTQYLYLRASRR
ncbi:hypothetical protein BOTBODRAFT_112397, partial [Botryobasidium botryosum FD-172 SS1]